MNIDKLISLKDNIKTKEDLLKIRILLNNTLLVI